ncbi:MAG: tRNA (adenosine(37)-N6)-dimethylallyltransferase MiaA [Calditerrivibrio sp.]|nr:tRNA (adenosine(37)-N6)-dimethylallyltransferase MiaA [Calditerrivibrio sp.]MCA1933256.1 tRNA (adenosine(37)-N6)-dimethylallyltransferase MiaA [Calditerrivibrio sp.]MCA1980324.1 tRNA (adenosine(37)-N6)-dimethylallyltransferase MiaA [Calditerrivibrio sp.]
MKIPIITGYTSSGKTALSLAIADFLDIEIISADAFQVYRGMDIGTGKPDKDELLKVRHHMIDILNPDEQYSAGDFFEMAEDLIDQIIKRGKIPLIVGGTGLYVETLINGIFAGPEKNNEFRIEMAKDIGKKGIEYFYKLLMEKDPIYAQKISHNDINKIIRAFEIIYYTKMTVTDAHRILHRTPKYKYSLYLIDKDRENLYKSINQRVEKMFASGWVDEVKYLLMNGYKETMSSFKAIGYREIANFIKNGGNLEETISDIQKKTRNFAKRQITWFKHMNDLNKLTMDKLNIKQFSIELLRQIDPENS